MNKKLPNVYAVPITKKLNNNKEMFKSGESDGLRKANISSKEINEIFNAKDHVYKTKVIVTTIKETKEVEVVGLTSTALLTLNGETIKISDILDIKKV